VDLARNLIGRINVGDSLTRTAAARPGQLAVVDGERRLSYADFKIAQAFAGPPGPGRRPSRADA
jgi:hypothetical protein